MTSWNVYPRPQLVREEWECLNGEWKLNGDGVINVPFCPESELSGVAGQKFSGKLTCERTLSVPAEWQGRHILLHFGAVDQIAEVYIDDTFVGKHEGGYLPFSFDITEYVETEREEESDQISFEWNNEHTLRVIVTDELDHKYPWGKQKADRGGMWYTPVSGIWQTVWMEPVSEHHIESLKIDTGMDWVEIRAYGIESGTIELLGEKHELIRDEAAGVPCASIHVAIHHPRLWSPEDPFLYDFSITSGDGSDRDGIKSYFALRTLGIAEVGGYRRLCLNGEPYFFNGLLDQGYWPDGIYTPAGPEAYEFDITQMKELGFNTLRKHIKIEPEQFYYDCDRLGMIVFQDMVNNGDYSFMHDTALPTIGIKKLSDVSSHPDKESREIFLSHMEGTVKHLYNHPSICYWTIFNEGWGQFCADAAYDRLKALDPTRFVDATSGWFHQKKSDVDSHHIYFKPLNIKAGSRPLVLSEFGGYACKLPEHCFNSGKTYGYRKCADEAALLRDMAKLYTEEVYPLIDRGLCAAIYTQVSDVEDETNGMLTYDRQVRKFKPYTATGRIEIIGNHVDHQGGRILDCPTREKIRAYVADNHSDIIRIYSQGFDPLIIDTGSEITFERSTTGALVAGILAGFTDLFGKADFSGRGFDCYIRSEVKVGGGTSSSAAFEVLFSRIINDRYYDNRADAVQIAKISYFAEREFFGKLCGMQDQLAVSLGRLVLLDFGMAEPEYEFIDFDFNKTPYKMRIIQTDSDHADKGADFDSIPKDMYRVAELMGLKKLGEISSDTFKRRLPELEAKVKEGEITELQLNRARHYYDEVDRVLTGATALQAGNFEKFLACVDASGRSSEELLKNIVPEGVTENDLSRTIAEYRAKPTTAALKLEGGGFGGSILVFEK